MYILLPGLFKDLFSWFWLKPLIEHLLYCSRSRNVCGLARYHHLGIYQIIGLFFEAIWSIRMPKLKFKIRFYKEESCSTKKTPSKEYNMSALACFTKHAKCMTCLCLETSLQMQRVMTLYGQAFVPKTGVRK